MLILDGILTNVRNVTLREDFIYLKIQKTLMRRGRLFL